MNALRPGIIDFKQVGQEETGYLSMAQWKDPLPFKLQRSYWLYENKTGQIKGNHATKVNAQVLVVLHGMVEIELLDQSENKSTYTLYNPAQGLYIPSMYWRKVTIVEPSIVLGLCSAPFKEEDYIRDFEEFKGLSL